MANIKISLVIPSVNLDKKLRLFLEKIHFDDTTVSTILGIFVMLILGSLIINYFREVRNVPRITEEAAQTVNTQLVAAMNDQETVKQDTEYTVHKDDSLWKIAVKIYGNGYAWTNIAQKNNLINPDTITVGQQLVLPSVSSQPIQAEVLSALSVEETKDDETVVNSGDTLWNIALKTYASGYVWPKIAAANNIKNPNHIEVGQRLILPR